MRLGLLVEGGLVLLSWAITFTFGIYAHWRGLALGTTLATGVLATLPMFGAFVFTWRADLKPMRQLRATLTAVLGSRLRHTTIWELALLSLLAGLGEEWLFRGLIQGGTAPHLGTTWGLALGAIIFGLAHSLSLTYALAATIMGVILGMMYQWTGGLLAPVVAHALYDFLALLFVRRELADSR